MTRHLTTEQALRTARRAVGGPVQVRDYALVVGIASGEISDVAEIASALGEWAK